MILTSPRTSGGFQQLFTFSVELKDKRAAKLQRVQQFITVADKFKELLQTKEVQQTVKVLANPNGLQRLKLQFSGEEVGLMALVSQLSGSMQTNSSARVMKEDYFLLNPFLAQAEAEAYLSGKNTTDPRGKPIRVRRATPLPLSPEQRLAKLENKIAYLAQNVLTFLFFKLSYFGFVSRRLFFYFCLEHSPISITSVQNCFSL